MKIKSISYTKSQTINTGNFENTKIEIGYTLELDSDDDVQDERKKLIKSVNKALAAEVGQIEKSVK